MRESDGLRDADTPSLTTLHVSSEQVAAVPGMPDLIESIRQYVSPDRPENGAENVAIVFSAIFMALRIGGVTMERNCLALSHFQFGFRGEGYEIPLSISLLHAASQTQPLDAPGASFGSVDRCGPRKRKHAKAAAQEACTRHALLLKKLFERTEGASDDSQMLARRLSARAVVPSALPPSPGTISASAVTEQLEELLDRESECKRATGRVYEAYAHLGDSFVRLVATVCQETPPSAETKAFHRKGFAILEEVTTHWTRRAELTRSALVKRLERARKFHLLARCFGEQVLTSEALTMRLVDRTTFQSFSILLQEAAPAQAPAPARAPAPVPAPAPARAPCATESEQASAKWSAPVPATG
ncbi:uncharacterized protein PSANT_06973 [Moesziomyces antarcticus]|uniref:Uncharacterized protein n=1 Tax=Pseudozyma antarctica TaxID=84753 RepID=A0A5C3FYB7_PSEA2|nr:uncharacterized protein PSANT_06973 [Moesziomyces antarcticus]